MQGPQGQVRRKAALRILRRQTSASHVPLLAAAQEETEGVGGSDGGKDKWGGRCSVESVEAAGVEVSRRGIPTSQWPCRFRDRCCGAAAGNCIAIDFPDGDTELSERGPEWLCGGRGRGRTQSEDAVARGNYTSPALDRDVACRRRRHRRAARSPPAVRLARQAHLHRRLRAPVLLPVRPAARHQPRRPECLCA